MEKIKNRPYVVCHMLASLNGKIDGAFFSAPECGPALAEYADLREFYGCQATLYGTTTMLGGYAQGMAGELPETKMSYPIEDYIASVADSSNSAASIFEKSEFLPGGAPVAFHLKEVRQTGGGSLWLRYSREG